MREPSPVEGNYVAGPHLYVEPFVLLGHRHRAGARPARIGDYAVIRSHSVIYGDVEIGERFKCGHSVVIRAETSIGDSCVVGGRTTIEGRARIGTGCRIMSHCYICSRTTIGDYVFVGPNCTFLNDRYPMRREAEAVGPTIESHACIGGGVTLGPGVRIGEGSFVAAGCVVHKDVPPGSLAIGVPARIEPLPERLRGGTLEALVAAPMDLWYPEECRRWNAPE
jgi:acetyltransferase-like isoleucine patch superfamily enzyme